ncbi:uncharacterized protein LOC111069488 [Drosophila obscura]|uniref:uncharacterized protein LOC111069488 n=1 Tax=Drosophila obscura TaxID=7282 RepID=UPI001BB17652|nr:uncharacterized protein LOC111069488 [Drosophila obscura]XP_022215264.2 uncharacterized protein LOC111069488 [Drosophila obscura]XP_022215265.2 uncharacterized protein LOC111069488 [Drosophila obscura]XP_022215266.2 uncharacterized protein LOC111069488 [Drosophila obscura]
MQENDLNERQEEPASLPPTSNDTNNKNTGCIDSNELQIPSEAVTVTVTDQQQQQPQEDTEDTQITEQVIDSSTTADTETGDTTRPERLSTLSLIGLYPAISEAADKVVDQAVDEPSSSSVVDPDRDELLLQTPRRKRQRRVYTADTSRCSSLRSRQESKDTSEAGLKQVPTTPPPAQVASSPTPTESTEYIKSEQFNPAFWNLIEEEEVKFVDKRRRVAGGRSRTRRSKLLNELGENYSPETAAAIAAAQLELDSTGKPSSRATRKRNSAMSLYDRRYQSTSEERRVPNGYGGTGLRTGSSATSSDIEPQELQVHQYYGSSGGSNPTGAGTGLNGSGAALNHAPSMGTLCNIGNTCYLNSVVYTLRFAPLFLHNLHHLIHDLNVVQQTILRQQTAKSASLGRNVSGAQLEHARSWSSKDLATTEPFNSTTNGSSAVVSSGSTTTSSLIKASSQSVTEKLHELYHSLHGNEMADSTEPYHADTLLHAIQDVNTTFQGNQQQDAHEFLMCVLNCIRETNQSLIKSINECPQVIVNGYIANPDELDSGEAAQERTDTAMALASSGNGNTLATSQITTTKTSFFSRKSKRKDEVKSSKSTRIQSPLKDNSPTAGGLTAAPAHSTANSLFYLNTVDLSGASSVAATAAATPTVSQPASTGKYSSDDEMNPASALKDSMRLEDRIRDLNLNFFNADFEGIVVLTTKCLSCETVTKQKQGMLDISVPITGCDNADLQDKPSTYIQNSCITKEYFQGENKYSCSQCTGYTEAIRSISYEVLPRLLVIQLNRFSGGMQKVSTYVPTTFTLPCFCAKCCELSDGNKLHVYKLYSVITHVGATLSVGHYIAYTCFLDLPSDYINCPKDRRNTMSGSQTQQAAAAAAAAAASSNENAAPNNGSSSSHVASTPVAAAASVLASSGTSLIKKMKFGRSKASSSGDMSKNVKQLNGISSKNITNGIGKLSMNTTCHGVSCCAMRLCCSQQPSGAAGSSNSASCSDFSEESLQNGSNSNLSHGSGSGAAGGSGSGNNSSSNVLPNYPTGYGSTGRGGVKANYAHGGTEPIWYMCDDDKIKAMTQREFEELLSPSRKITITPYLLFYARFDLQPASKTAGTTSSTPPPPSASSQSSWSNEAFSGSGGGGAHKI